MKKSMKSALGLCATTAVLATTFLIPFSSSGVAAAGAVGTAATTVRTDAEIVRMAPAAQGALLDPLRAVAGALYSVGGSAGRGVFAGVVIDANHGVVNLYVKDPARAAGIIRAALSARPGISTSLIRVKASAHSAAELDAARTAYLHSHPTVHGVSVSPEGTGIEVDAPVAAALRKPIPALRTVPRTAKINAWNNVKWHDHAPFIGGDVLTAGQGKCTAGLPAVRKSDGRPVMITASHCFGMGAKVYTANGATWAWGNHATGNFVGTVTAQNRQWDADVLTGANNNADESDVDGWVAMTSAAYSFKGDFVCHSGAKSAFFGHPSPCGIKVTKPDYKWTYHGFWHRGVEGVDINGWGSVGGDSGATVWSTTSNPKARQARGIVIDGGADNTVDQRRVDWTEAVDIFNAFGLKLNPKT